MKTILGMAAVAALTLPAAACGGAPASTRQDGAAAFSTCMRAHGVPSYPDPGPGGVLPKKTLQELRVGASVFQSAQSACIHLVPNGGRPTQAQIRQVRGVMLRYARCMRAHGVSNMPDPDSRGHLDIGPGSAVDVNGPRFQAAYGVCRRELTP